MERNKHERNKKYGWLVFFALVNWLVIALAVWKIDPDNMANFLFPGSYLPMGLLLMGGIFWLYYLYLLTNLGVGVCLKWYFDSWIAFSMGGIYL
ncbi:MAG: hypothetical protein UV30_C0009G0026 [Candidatus Collierbacteria bacterium GW2011_GWF1_42_50]|nr:MAG: hypothetical protein UV30_C0009G0026 [Candidatus Collierbacteria bacterium GW2011_GWF1_42_50]